ncbi:hypothetical protein C8J57DRAFT_1252874 [Mycena rebaudengoi]|nr:hypothetical protein C8J57DRAFT_1252874 [Mycena rebaudengoi]
MPPPKMGTLEYEVPKVAILRSMARIGSFRRSPPKLCRMHPPPTPENNPLPLAPAKSSNPLSVAHICGSVLPKSRFKSASIGPTQSNISSSLKIPPVHLNWSAAQLRNFVVPILWRRIIALIILIIPTPDITSFGHSKPSQQIILVTSRSSARIVYGSGFSATYQLHILPPTADAVPPLRPSTARLLPNSSALTMPIRPPPRTLAGKCRTLGEALNNNIPDAGEGLDTAQFPCGWQSPFIGTLAPKINGWLPPSEE